MKTRRIFYFLMAIITCLPLMAACAGGGEITADPNTETLAPEPVVTEMPDLCLNGFTIIRAEKASQEEIDLAVNVRKTFRDLGDNFDISISDDFIMPGKNVDGDPEIIVGLTNRPESANLLESIVGYYDYGIHFDGTKIYLYANTLETLAEAIEYFKANLRVEGDKVYYTGKNYTCRKDYPLAEGKMGGYDIGDYSIIYASDSERERNIAESLSLNIARLTGKKPAVIADSEPAGEKEIIIGAAKREGTPSALEKNEYIISADNGKVFLCAGNALGYDTVNERMEALMTENKIGEGFKEEGTFEIKGLDGAKVMFVGNSFLYYGYCTTTKNKIVFDDKGYFHTVAEKMGDDVYVTSITYGGKGFKALYDILVDNYPNYYGKSDKTDEFYNQDFVILQQEGSNASSTMEYAEKIMALFPPETRFAFFIHHHNAQNNHTNVLKTAERLRDTKGVIYIPEGHLVYDIWKGNVKVPGATLSYNKNSFVVNHTDTHHPNYLNGYLTALSCYYALTGTSITDCPHDFVRTTMEYYTKARSNYDDILASEPDMKGLKQLVEEYVDKYN